MIDLIGGQIDVMFDQAAKSLPPVRDGAIKAYAVTSAARLRTAPDIPTVDELACPIFTSRFGTACGLRRGRRPRLWLSSTPRHRTRFAIRWFESD
jgi:tripartite-type tricarboxylate transporter receptor subunit TctC